MNLLIDTHIWIWWLQDDPKLPHAAHRAMSQPGNSVWVSSVSMWELQIKRQIGKLRVDGDAIRATLDQGPAFLPFEVHHAAAVLELPLRHKDPFDRAILAQARVERLAILTVNAQFSKYADFVRLHSM